MYMKSIQTQQRTFIFGTCSTTSAMTSVMIALLLTVWALPIQGSAGGMSTNVANFMSTLNGYYDNKAQYQMDNTSHDYIQCRSVPVTTPAIPGKTVMFTEWAFNGVVLNLELSDLTDGVKGLIKLAVYNFTTDPNQYKPGEYKVEDLAKLTPENLQRPSTCEADFEPVGSGKFVGTWPACRHYVQGKPDLYEGMADCNTFEIVIPRSVKEKSSSVPYNMVIRGDKFKVPGAPNGFVNPCS